MTARRVAAANPWTTGRWAIGFALVFILSVTTGVVYALFSAEAATAGGVIVNGDLQLDPDASTGSAVSWVETTAAVPAGDRASGVDFASLAAFPGVPGDSVEVRYAVEATLVGDNLSAVLRATLGAALPAGVAASGYRVLDENAALLAPSVGTTPLGDTVVVAPLQTAGTVDMLVAVELTWTGSVSTLSYTADVTTTTSPTLMTLPITLALEQVRTGAGFVP